MVASFECVTRSSRSVEEMFDLARSIDAHTESQAASAEEAVGGVTRGLIGAGQDVTWTARHFGIRFSLTSAITEFEPPRRFVDEQTRGPFASFRHEHVFEPADSGSVMIDRIRFAAPLGPLGRVAEKLVLEPYLRRLIAERGAFLAGPSIAPATG
ncbi:SRPBCC family protein [Herbiconiux sp. CPCC 203407]|uniref:SRPBCC family protein n=1 Tax=Herbiconiux oxytropis TaxID=2970915 RepID=A0AA41XIF6_9MICO|nr:SRPBCC family protein [Herbiconiux oxytropis]MCS5724092.1 SRPBCC family protein [Herbiconiux oxytropis]MCS5726975.1 SRPBCC family protein [Herbiconiux oxytropis]